MTGPISIEQLKNASADASTLAEVLNGNDNTDVTSRLNQRYPTLAKALKLILQNGLLGATPFRTYDAMLSSDLPNNSYAVVTHDDDLAKNGIYLKDGQGYHYSDMNTSPQLMSELNKLMHFDTDFYDDEGRKVAWGVVDDTDKLGAYVADDGTINANNIKSVQSSVAWGVVDEDDKMAIAVLKDGSFAIGNGLNIAQTTTFPFAVVDNNGRMLFAIDKSGQAVSEDAIKSQQQLHAQQEKIQALTNQNDPITLHKTDFMQVIGYGQSLSRGAGSFPIINTTQPYHNKMFKSGVKSRQMDNNHDFSDFVPLIEIDSGSWEGETPMSAMLNDTVKSMVDGGQKSEEWQFVATSSGMGGQPIEVLSKGRPLYDGVLEQVRAGVNVANAKGSSYSVWAITWTQGEDNANTAKDEYKRLLHTLYDDLVADIKAITKQEFDPIMIMYQTAAHRRYGKDDNPVAIAQLEAVNQHAKMMMATPIYHLPHEADNLHLTGDSSVQLGKYYAIAFKHAISTGKKWQPLQPLHILAQGNVIDIVFNKSGLVLDTQNVAQTHNYGFDIYDKEGNVIDIISQITLHDNRVKIQLSSPIPPDSYLSYAKGRKGDPQVAGHLSGSRGNLRDNADPVGYQDSTGKQRFMHNWCVMFTQSLNPTK